ncbi:hypothetical protein I6N89_22805 [Pelagibaca abyssi]|nr:hypothetical protein [Salipiger abyssi]
MPETTQPQEHAYQTFTISLRVSADEKARLERDAAGMSRSAYMRERLFGQDVTPRKTRGKSPVADYEALARVLAALGRSDLAQSFEGLSWAEANGVVKIDPATSEAIRQACKDVSAMRDDLVSALGLKPERR